MAMGTAALMPIRLAMTALGTPWQAQDSSHRGRPGRSSRQGLSLVSLLIVLQACLDQQESCSASLRAHLD